MPPHSFLSKIEVFFNGYDLVLCRRDLLLLIGSCWFFVSDMPPILGSRGTGSSWHLKKGAICLHGKGADVRNGVVDFYNKQGYTPNLIVFPIPRSYDTDYLSYEALENIKDMYFYSGKYEGGQICGNCPHLLVFANCPPNITKMSEDRWRVVELKGNKKGEEILIEDIEL